MIYDNQHGKGRNHIEICCTATKNAGSVCEQETEETLTMGSAGENDHRNLIASRRDILLTSVAALGSAALTKGLHAEERSAQGGLARSKQGMVTSPHDLASQAGLEVLQAGGNAIEAAIAIGATLSVTYPHFSGLGGDAFMIISDRKGNVLTL